MASRYSQSVYSSTSTQESLKTSGKDMEEDLWATYPDPGSDSESENEMSENEMDSVEDPEASKSQSTRTERPALPKLKIVLPPRKRGSAVIAARNVSDEPPRRREDSEYDDRYEDSYADEGSDHSGYEDGDGDAEVDSGDEEEEETRYRELERDSGRSPLSATRRRTALPPYPGYRCEIWGCKFRASTVQHLKHHVATAQHSRVLRS